MKEHLKTVLKVTTLASLFGLGILYFKGIEFASQFFSAYFIEYSLSLDNLMVFSLIFAQFQIPAKEQPAILKWGIIGAVVLRGVFILAGATLLSLFKPLLYVLGLVLIISAIKMLRSGDDPEVPGKALELANKFKLNTFMTCLLVVEFSDIIFALDSIPTTFGITQDPLIVFASNMFAIMGLRSLYFILLEWLDKFENLKYGISIVLLFIGFKIAFSWTIEIPTIISLMITFLMIGLSIHPKSNLIIDFVKQKIQNIRTRLV